MSAVEALCAKVEELSRAINDLREKSEGNSGGIRTKECTNVDKKSNEFMGCNEVAVFETEKHSFNNMNGRRDDSIPIKPLIVMNGTLNERNVRILKDDGCNTNVVSKKFVQKNAGAFKTMCRNVTVNHSAEDKVEQATQVLLEGNFKMGNHEYVSNFVVANCRYDVLLGMQWHVAQDPKVSYSAREVHVKDVKIPVDTGDSLGSKTKVQSMSVKSFRRDLRAMNNRNAIKVFKLAEVSNMGYSLACACLAICDHILFIMYVCIHVIGQANFEVSKQVQASRTCEPLFCKSRLLALV
jgi:hypothetical protein